MNTPSNGVRRDHHERALRKRIRKRLGPRTKGGGRQIESTRTFMQVMSCHEKTWTGQVRIPTRRCASKEGLVPWERTFAPICRPHVPPVLHRSPPALHQRRPLPVRDTSPAWLNESCPPPPAPSSPLPSPFQLSNPSSIRT